MRISEEIFNKAKELISIGYYIGLDKTAIPVEIRISDKLV